MVFLDAPGKINGGRSGMWTPSLSKPGSRSADLSEGRLPSTERRGEPGVPQPGRIRAGDGFVSVADLACDVSAIWDVELRFQRSFTPDPACSCPLLLHKGTPRRAAFAGFPSSTPVPFPHDSTIPESSHRRKTSTLSFGHAPSHGIVPLSSRRRISGACVRTSP